jgi:hypothetical protein
MNYDSTSRYLSPKTVGQPVLVTVMRVGADLRPVSWSSLWYYAVVVHLRPTNRLSQEDPIILPVNCSLATSKFSPRDLTSSQAKLVVLESTLWDVHSSERKLLLHKLVMEELSFSYFWNHGVHKQLLYALFHTYSVHADALTEMQFGSLNALITPNCIIPVGESRLVSAPLFDLELLVDYELLDSR